MHCGKQIDLGKTPRLLYNFMDELSQCYDQKYKLGYMYSLSSRSFKKYIISSISTDMGLQINSLFK